MKMKKKTRIKIGDLIKVISGNQKGFVGKINNILQKSQAVLINGIPSRIKYSKKSVDSETKKLEKPTLIHISSVMLHDTETNTSSKIGYKLIDNVKKRYFKKSGKLI